MKSTKLTYLELVSENTGMSFALSQIGIMIFEKAPLQFLLNISENSQEIDRHIKIFNETRDKVLKEFAKTDKEGNTIINNGEMIVVDEKFEEFNVKMGKLYATEIELQLKTISRKELSKSKTLTANIIRGLTPILTK